MGHQGLEQQPSRSFRAVFTALLAVFAATIIIVSSQMVSGLLVSSAVALMLLSILAGVQARYPEYFEVITGVYFGFLLLGLSLLALLHFSGIVGFVSLPFVVSSILKGTHRRSDATR